MRLARQLKLSGGVRNLSDGRVEVRVFGDEAAVEDLINWLKIGPKHAKVSTIDVIEMDLTEIDANDLSADDVTKISVGQFVVWPTR